MTCKRGLKMLSVVLCTIGVCEVAGAPAPLRGGAKPLASSSCYAKQELATIYNESIGSGYSAQSLNSISLANARNQSLTNVTSTGGSAPRISLQPSGSAAKPFSGF